MLQLLQMYLDIKLDLITVTWCTCELFYVEKLCNLQYRWGQLSNNFFSNLIANRDHLSFNSVSLLY